MNPGESCWVQIATEDSDTFPDLFARAKIESVDNQTVKVAYDKPQEGLPAEVSASVLS